MRKMNNKGFSMVEILIAITIFAVLMVPIIGAIISSLKSTTDAKTLQYRNEFVENVVEYVKQDSLENIFVGDYFTTIGSYTSTAGKPINVSAKFNTDGTKNASGNLVIDETLASVNTALSDLHITPEVQKTNVVFGAEDEDDYAVFPYEEYWLSGTVDLGVKDIPYSYKVQISNKYYAEKQKDDGYANPNNLALGIVEDIDYTKVALINGTIANYDNTVYETILTKKLGLLKQVDPAKYDIYMQQVEKVVKFEQDSVKRLITIKVTGSESTGYTVTCNMKYNDDGQSFRGYLNSSSVSQELKNRINTELIDAYVEYEPFEFTYEPDASGKAKLPNIYLMYNVCAYNGKYAQDDFIAVDATGVTDDTKIKLFVVETAETYSENITNVTATNNKPALVVSGDLLYNNDLEISTNRDSCKIHMGVVQDPVSKKSNINNISVYHNFNLYGGKNVNLTNSNIVYANQHNGFNDTVMFPDSTYLPLEHYTDTAMKSKVSTKSIAEFGPLNSATEDSRGLYEIKVWMVEGNDPSVINTSDQPVMTATKGGNDS